MDVFSILLIDLFIATVIFYISLFIFIFYWHLTKVSFVVVPLIFTFEFFAVGFFIILIITIVVKYLPLVVNLLGL